MTRDLIRLHDRPLPWIHSAEGRRDNEPRNLSELELRAAHDRVAEQHYYYLRKVDDELIGRWGSEWDQLLAVGPFTDLPHRRRTVPFVLVADYRRPYRHLLKLARTLGNAYLEFGILPDVHLISTRLATELEYADNRLWEATKELSIVWRDGR